MEVDKNKQENPKKLHFEKMNPTSCKEIECYQEALDYVFSEKDVLNIAITGPYSAGKSSVIKTYEMIENKKAIHISLSNFEESKEKMKDCKKYVEGNIINQLIHQIPSSNIPRTDFKVKQYSNNNKPIMNTILLTIFIILLVYVYNFSSWKKIIENIYIIGLKEALQLTATSGFYISSLITLFVVIFYFIYVGIDKYIEKPFLKKIKISNSEVELFEDKNDSLFNKYLDEIIYIILNAGVDVIVFEDIDRYEDTEIFTKLREINILVNNKNKLLKDNEYNPIKFIYVLRDDLFLSKDRTKFFDFILPIVPVIDSSNSYDVLIKNLEKCEVYEKLDKLFIERMCLYIDDMRLLKNVYNEFVVYIGRLKMGSIELDYNKLLALLVYKNIFPKDFSELQLNKGYVFSVLSNKNKLVENKLQSIDSKIQKIKTYIDNSDKERLLSEDELDAMYWHKLNINSSYYVKDKKFDEYRTLVEVIRAVKDNNYIVKNGYRGYDMDIKDRFENLKINDEYNRRKENIKLKSSNQRKKLEEELGALLNQKKKICSLKISELLNENNEEILYSDINEEDFNSILENQYYDLIKYLIRSGMIDETYSNYLTYFYGNTLSKVDKDFLMSLTNHKTLGFDYELNDPEYLITKLEESDFAREEVLNFKLLDALLDSENKFLLDFLDNIASNSRSDFIFEYIKRNNLEEKKNFFVKLNENHPDIFDRIINGSIMIYSDINLYLAYTFVYCNVEDYIEMNEDDIIKYYIEAHSDFLNLHFDDEGYIKKILAGLSNLDIKFKKIDYTSSNKKLFDEVYKNNLYMINSAMIELILQEKYEFIDKSKYYSKNYSLISSRPDEPLKKYIDDNINEYCELMLSKASEDIEDEEEFVLEILNNEEIELQYKEEYIQKLSTRITMISKIDKKELYEQLLDNEVAAYNLGNILEYYEFVSKKIDDILIKFIESSNNDIEFIYDKDTYDIDKFLMSVLKDNRLSINRYKMFMDNYSHVIDEFDFSKLDEEKVELLINLEIIKMTQYNIKLVRDKYPNLVNAFIKGNLLEFGQLLDDKVINIRKEEIVNVLMDKDIQYNEKVSLLSNYEDSLEVNSAYSDEIKSYIINNNFEWDDFSNVLSFYENGDDILKESIQDLCIKYIEDLVYSNYKIDNNLLKFLLGAEIDDSYKKKLILNYNENIDLLKLHEYFKIANFNKYLNLLAGKRPRIEITDEDEELLEYLKSKNWVKSFQEDTDGAYFRTYGIKHEL